MGSLVSYPSHAKVLLDNGAMKRVHVSQSMSLYAHRYQYTADTCILRPERDICWQEGDDRLRGRGTPDCTDQRLNDVGGIDEARKREGG